jgi:endonuclease/exonuclease/phosphatase family metal-dependent hydrolase
LILGGDFNILRFSSYKNKNFSKNKATDLLNWIINTYELRYLTLLGGKYIWSNNQQNPTLEKLDRILISDDWEKHFPLTNLRKLPRELSDHNPLLLCTEQFTHKKSKAFCFETSWLKHQEFLPKNK